MALLTRSLPRVMLDYGDGMWIEMKLLNIESAIGMERIGATRIRIDGEVLDSDLIKGRSETITYPPTPIHRIAGKAGDPVSVGGIPEECILTCSGCGHVDEETHECSV